MWNLRPPPNFKGLRPDKPLHCYHRHLPHWRQDGATYAVTFRLGDSLPQEKLNELDALRREWECRHPQTRSDELIEQLNQEIRNRVDHWLDQGMGSCDLAKPQFAKYIVESLHHFALPSRDIPRVDFPGRQFRIPTNRVSEHSSREQSQTARYELGCYVVMPNHVHAVVRPLDGKICSLEEIVGSWKQYSSYRINRDRGTKGDLWQEETYDRIIRDEEHLWNVIQYIGRNPEKAKLSSDAFNLWVCPEWEELGWTFEFRRA